MSEYQQQVLGPDLRVPSLVRRANTRQHPESPLSNARRRSVTRSTERGVIQEGRDRSGCIDALRPLLTEELAHLRPIMTTLGWAVGCQLEGEIAPRVLFGQGDGHWASALQSTYLIAPGAFLYQPNGQLFGVMGSLWAHSARADTLISVVEALLRHAARSVSERWFRLHHREAWIVAAAPLSKPDHGVLLALDQHMTLRGSGIGAADVLGPQVRGTSCPHWEDLFTPVRPMPTMRGRADLAVRLTAVRDGQPWIGVLSAPDFRAPAAWSSDAFVHARPRLHQLAALAAGKFEEASTAASLTTGMRRRIEEFIEARLDTTLTVEEIARAAGMSCSHFTRAFRNAVKMTPHRYVMWRRLVRARELIKSSEASLAEIAVTTGFSDQSHLCRLFLQHLGESPRRYRSRWR